MPRLRAVEQRALQQRRADAVALPVVFDAEGGLGLLGEAAADRAQFGRAAQLPVDEEAVHDGVEPHRGVDVVADIGVRHAAAEAAVAAFRIEPQQMVAIFVGLSDPHFADQAAIGKRVEYAHSGLLTLRVGRPSVSRPSPETRRPAGRSRATSTTNAAMQQF